MEARCQRKGSPESPSPNAAKLRLDKESGGKFLRRRNRQKARMLLGSSPCISAPAYILQEHDAAQLATCPDPVVPCSAGQSCHWLVLKTQQDITHAEIHLSRCRRYHDDFLLFGQQPYVICIHGQHPCLVLSRPALSCDPFSNVL